MTIKLVISDIDGTLLNPAGHLPAATAQSIRALAAEGVQFASASGRSRANTVAALGPVLGAFGCFACANGALVLASNGETLAEHRMPARAAGALIDRCDLLGASYCCVGRDEALAVIRHPRTARVFALFHRDFREVPPRPDPPPDLLLMAVYAPDLSPILCALPVEPGDLAAGPVYRSQTTGMQFVLVQASGADKGTAAARVAQHLGVPLSETLAFGDGHWNDTPMLERVGFGVAMRNATEPLRAVARAVTLFDNREDGVGRFLRYLLAARR